MAKQSQYPNALPNPAGAPQWHFTSGNVAHPVEGLCRDAGLDKPPTRKEYGKVQDGPEVPKGEKMPSGNAKAMSAFFGNGKRGKV